MQKKIIKKIYTNLEKKNARAYATTEARAASISFLPNKEKQKNLNCELKPMLNRNRFTCEGRGILRSLNAKFQFNKTAEAGPFLGGQVSVSSTRRDIYKISVKHGSTLTTRKDRTKTLTGPVVLNNVSKSP